MLTPFQLGLGGVIGSGNQVPELDRRMTLSPASSMYSLLRACTGPRNSVSPHPVTNREFTKALGQILRRPTFFREFRDWPLAWRSARWRTRHCWQVSELSSKLLNSGYHFAIRFWTKHCAACCARSRKRHRHGPTSAGAGVGKGADAGICLYAPTVEG